jgi:ADP-ribose pyrophosphatase
MDSRSMPTPSRTRVHDFDFFRVRWLRRYGWIVERSPAVVVVALAPDGRVWLERLHREPLRASFWETPGGAIDRGESPIEAGLRELDEECGLVANGKVVAFPPQQPMPGMAMFPHHVVVARDVVPRGKSPVPQIEEGIETVRRFSEKQLRSMIRRGTLTVQVTVAALVQAGVL